VERRKRKRRGPILISAERSRVWQRGGEKGDTQVHIRSCTPNDEEKGVSTPDLMVRQERASKIITLLAMGENARGPSCQGGNRVRRDVEDD